MLISEQVLKFSCAPQPIAPEPFAHVPHELPIINLRYHSLALIVRYKSNRPKFTHQHYKSTVAHNGYKLIQLGVVASCYTIQLHPNLIDTCPDHSLISNGLQQNIHLILWHHPFYIVGNRNILYGWHWSKPRQVNILQIYMIWLLHLGHRCRRIH